MTRTWYRWLAAVPGGALILAALALGGAASPAEARGYGSPATGAFDVYGEIEVAYLALGGPRGLLGYPLTTELPAASGGRYNHFQSGSIYWTPATGAHEVHGAIRQRWAAIGWERGPLGYPVSDELPLPDGVGRVSHFQYGSIYWTPDTGAHEVYGALRQAWLAEGAERGRFGYPVRGEYDVTGGRESDFSRGFLRWDAATHEIRSGLGKVLAPGVAYRRIDDPAGPFSSRVLTLDPSGAATLDVGLAQGRLPGVETTSSIARRHRALAAVNGDFFLPSGRPVHLYAEDGRMVQAPALLENAFGAAGTGVASALGRPAPAMSATLARTGKRHPLARVNSGPPSSDELALHTPAGGVPERPLAPLCTASLRELAPPGRTTETVYAVTRATCGAGTPLVASETVLSAPLGGAHADFVRGLVPGDRLTVSWSVGWPGVTDVLGGNAVLVDGGQLTAAVTGSDPFFARHPRTGVGITRSGQVLLVTVDGRQPGYSVGMTLAEFGTHLRGLGAERALLLDGGGSTTMVVRDWVANRPSGGAERPAGNALLVLTHPDDLPPEPWRGASSADVTAQAWAEAARDAGSVGGWAKAARGRGGELPAELADALP